MPDFLIDMGIAALLRLLVSKKELKRWIPAIAKVYVKIEDAAAVVPELGQAIIEKQVSGRR